MRRDRLDYRISAYPEEAEAIRSALNLATVEIGVPLSEAGAEKVVEAISAFRLLSQRPSPSKMGEQIVWIRKSASDLKRALGGDQFRDAFNFLNSGTALREIHDRLTCLDAVLDADESALEEAVKQGQDSLAPQWRTSRRGHLALAAIETYLEVFPHENQVVERLRKFTGAVFSIAGESLSDAAIREILRSPLGGLKAVLKNKKPA